jgi:hypothetical protein
MQGVESGGGGQRMTGGDQAVPAGGRAAAGGFKEWLRDVVPPNWSLNDVPGCGQRRGI